MNKPNVVFILADDMGYGDFGVFSDGSAHTPILDDFVKEGICLTQQYSESPVCSPARAGLLTGRYHHRTGSIDMRELRGLNRLALRELTMGDIFKKNGYVTGLVGKWHNGTIGAAYHPTARGFDEFVGFKGGMSDYYDWNIYYNNTLHKSNGRYLTDVFADEAKAFIQRHKDEPFFLHVAFNAPHEPLQAPEEEIKPFRETGKYKIKVSMVYAMIKRMDKGIGLILDELKKQNLYNNTIVIFTSDNGPCFTGGKRYNAGLNGCKGNVYEGGIRVPGVIRWPAELRKSICCNEFIHFTDWLPTLIASTGIEKPDGLALDGENILPLLKGEPYEVNERQYWQWNRYTPLISCNAAMRDGCWKLIRPAIKEAMMVDEEDYKMDRIVEKNPDLFTDIVHQPDPERIIPEPLPALLYDLKTDPFEVVNLADKYPKRVENMLTELEKWFAIVEEERMRI